MLLAVMLRLFGCDVIVRSVMLCYVAVLFKIAYRNGWCAKPCYMLLRHVCLRYVVIWYEQFGCVAPLCVVCCHDML